MGVTMMCRLGALFALPLATAISAVYLSAPAFAAELPQIKISDGNKVPECVTPGRLSAFLESRNKSLNGRFETIAADYMRVGEELGIRWDVAFFQMLLETGNLAFTGDVSEDQNNFAGLGATGKKEPGERFPDVATGVKAHLQHLLMYAGENIENPVAERTRKVQEWGVLTSWLKTIDGPMTYTQLAKKWAPGSRSYSRDIANVSESFYDGLCKSADPRPEMMALARPNAETKTAKSEASAAAAQETSESASDAQATPKVSGAELARRAVAEARASGSFVRSNLGAGALAKAAETAATASPDTSDTPTAQPAFTIINAPKPEEEAAEAESPAAGPEKSAKIQTAALGSVTKAAVTPPAASKSKDAADPTSKCRVWTASYGGSRAIIIKAAGDQTTNYTVLDVNEGTEKREADAYIAAYAKGGQPVGEFANQTQALDKAFELCPEG